MTLCYGRSESDSVGSLVGIRPQEHPHGHRNEVIGVNSTKGSLEPGNDADIILLADEPNLVATIVGGEVVYRA